MSAKARSRADLVILGAIGMATCCALPVVVGVAGALGMGAVLDVWVLLAAAGAVAAGLLVRSPCGYRNGEDRMPSELATRRGV